MKKTLLAIGSIVTVAAPIAAVVSCGSKTTPKAHAQTTTQAQQNGLDEAHKTALKTWVHRAYPSIKIEDLGDVTIHEDGFDVTETSHADIAVSFTFNKDVNGLILGANTENVTKDSTLTVAAYKNRDIKLVLGTKEIAVSNDIKTKAIQAMEAQGFTFDAVPEVKEELVFGQFAPPAGFTNIETEFNAIPTKVEGAGHFPIPKREVVATPFIGFGSTPAVDHKVPTKVEGAGHIAVPKKIKFNFSKDAAKLFFPAGLQSTKTVMEIDALDKRSEHTAEELGIVIPQLSEGVTATFRLSMGTMTIVTLHKGAEIKRLMGGIIVIPFVKPDPVVLAETLGFTVGEETEVISWNDATPSKVEGAGHFAIPHKVIPTPEETVQPQAYQMEITDTATPTELAIESDKARVAVNAIISEEKAKEAVKATQARVENMATITQRAAEEAKQREEAVFELTHPQTDVVLNDKDVATAPTPVGHKTGDVMPVLQWRAEKDLALITELTTGRWKVDFNLQARAEEYTAEELGLINVPTLSNGVTAHYFIEAITGNKDVHVRVELHKNNEHRVFKNLDLQFGGRIASVEVDSNAKPEVVTQTEQVFTPNAVEGNEPTSPRAQTYGFWTKEEVGMTNTQFTPTPTSQANIQVQEQETLTIFEDLKIEREREAIDFIVNLLQEASRRSIEEANVEVWGMAAASLEVATPMFDLTPATPVHVPQPTTTNKDVNDLLWLKAKEGGNAELLAEANRMMMESAHHPNDIYTLEKK